MNLYVFTVRKDPKYNSFLGMDRTQPSDHLLVHARSKEEAWDVVRRHHSYEVGQEMVSFLLNKTVQERVITRIYG